jgi:hypothetical protein
MSTIPKKVFAGILSVLSLTSALASAETSLDASVSVANLYLYRGLNLGGGTPAVSGDLVANFDSGFYAGSWVGSGDTTWGAEVDLFAGWAADWNDISLDAGAYTYYYPNYDDYDTVGALSEVFLSIGYSMFTLGYKEFVAGSKTSYASFGGEYKAFSVLAGWANAEEPQGQNWSNDYGHLDVTYAFNERVSFTVSKVVHVSDEALADGSVISDDDALFVLAYSLPIDLD